MKVVAKPMGLPSSSLVTEKKLKKTEAGRKAFECIQDAINQGFLDFKNPKAFLKKWDKNDKKGGTCAGQATAMIIAKSKHPDAKGKGLVKKANMIDSIAYQIIRNVHYIIKRMCSKEGKKLLKKLPKEAEKSVEKADKRVKKELKKLHNKNT